MNKLLSQIIMIGLLSTFHSVLIAQEWHQLYFPNRSTIIYSTFESYDKGYIMGGDFEFNGIPSNGLIMKTDINGNMLWYKTISQSDDVTSIVDINATYDNGFILTGITGEYSVDLNPFIMKLDPCAEPEWCRIYLLPSHYQEWGKSIQSIPGGYVALFYAYGDDIDRDRIWLYRLDNNGELLWKQVYTQSDTAIDNPDPYTLHVSSDYHFIISADCYYPDPGSAWPKILRPFIVKTDSTGLLDWELPWASINGASFHGQGYFSVTDNQGTIYSAARHISYDPPIPGDKPCLIKTTGSGNEAAFYDLFPTSLMGGTSTINWFTDSTLAITYGWTDTITTTQYATIGILKCTRSGNILIDKPVLIERYLFYDAEITFDDKILVVGNFPTGSNWHSHAYKLNSNLQFDSIYTQPFMYDSLCPHPIPSDTIPMGCVVVGTPEAQKEEERTDILAYPNPVKDVLHLLLPNQLKSMQKTSMFNVTTYRARWLATEVEVYDLFGKRHFARTVPFGDKELSIDMSDWPAGMYMVRLVYNGTTVGTAKVLKN